MRSATGRTASEREPVGVFLGRDAEVARVVAARGGATGRFVLVRGEGGIGKTSLIRAALARMPGDHSVLSGAADAIDRRRVLGLLLDAFAPMLTVDDLPLVARQNEHALGERLLSLIDTVTAKPTVIVLEDLQWADAASLRLLVRLTRTLAQLPLLVIGSMRTQARHETSPELDHLLSVLDERRLLVSVEVGPLPAETCAAIAERLAAGRTRGIPERYVASAGGNPLFLTEMVRALLRDGTLAVDDRDETRPDAPVGPSPSLSSVMMRHLAHLTPPTRELLTAAALLGTRFPVTQLRVVVGRPTSALVPLLNEALAAGFLEEIDARTLGFRHQLIQEALLQDLPAPVRAELRRETAIRLDAAHFAAATVAAHLLRAPASAEDLEWMLRLAESAAVSAPDTAVDLWDRVIAEGAPGDPTSVRATAGLARAALSAGRAAHAAELAESALRHEVPAEVLAGLSATYTHALMQQHRNAAARDEAEKYAASEVLEPGDRAAHLAFAGWPRFMLGDLDGATRLAREGASMAAAAGNSGAEALALALHGQIADVRGELDDAVALLTRATQVADRQLTFASIEAFPHALLALALTDAGESSAVLELLQRSVRGAEEFGYRTGVLAAHAFGAQVVSQIGSLSDTWAELEAHGSMIGSMDVRMIGPILGMRACVVSHRSGPEAAREWAGLLDPVPDRAAWAGRGRSWIWSGLSQRARAGRDAGRAFGILRAGWRELRAGEMLMDCAEIGLELVHVARLLMEADAPQRAEALEQAHEVVDALTGLADRNPGVVHLRATALAVRGRASGVADDLVEAARMLASTPRRLQHARTGELAARVLPQRGDERRVLAEAALRSYAEAGADHEVSRARSAFRRAGIPVRTQRHSRPTSGWEALTRTEERVSGLVATGATNPEIAESLSVSRRTVETHVSNALSKLGLRSRTELALLVARRADEAG